MSRKTPPLELLTLDHIAILGLATHEPVEKTVKFYAMERLSNKHVGLHINQLVAQGFIKKQDGKLLLTPEGAQALLQWFDRLMLLSTLANSSQTALLTIARLSDMLMGV